MRLRNGVIALIGVVTLANAAWMLIAPLHWYHNLPAGVPDYGPFNPHFVRDIGCTFLALGAALIWASVRAEHAFPLVSIAALFATLHAAVHVFDTACGAVGGHHWLLDLPLVYLPAAALTVIAWQLRKTS